MSSGKATGSDDILIEALKARGVRVNQQLAILYTRCLRERVGFPRVGSL